jgi:hypothetical protein
MELAFVPAGLQVGGPDPIRRDASELEDDGRAVMPDGRELPCSGSCHACQDKRAADSGREQQCHAWQISCRP